MTIACTSSAQLSSNPCSYEYRISYSTHQVWVLHLFHHRNVVQLDVEVLVDRFQGAADADVIFQLDGDGLVGESFEEAVKNERFELGHIY